jgi:glutathione S-transferase
MINLHHLNNSRSQRVLWLLEELKLKYSVERYERDAQTRLAPPELMSVHPLGKSPVITDGKLTVAESGAIVDYLIQRYGRHKLMPSEHSADYVDYLQWMHYAEGSAMLPLMLALYVGRLGEAGAPLGPRIASEIALHFGYIEKALEGREFLVGKHLSGADIQMSFPLEAANARGRLKDFPNAARYLAALQARPAYKRALERGGTYDLGA